MKKTRDSWISKNLANLQKNFKKKSFLDFYVDYKDFCLKKNWINIIFSVIFGNFKNSNILPWPQSDNKSAHSKRKWKYNFLDEQIWIAIHESEN